MRESSNRSNEPIAIIGSGCKFPGEVNSPSELWSLLEHPRDVLSRIPKERFNIDAFYHSDGSHHGKTNVQHAYLLSGDARAFDASFFNIKPHEADCIDPQQRMLLETVYDSLCAAGLKIEDLQNTNTATYVGVMSVDYSDIIFYDLNSAPTYTATGSARSILSNRLSYFFNWHGPSMTIDTACSSSLVALHHAVQALRNGESNIAVAAGTNLILGPNQFIVESKLNMLSPNGRSRMWDAEADGYARGEGIAAVVMKTLSQALEDGDHIECIIRETGVNQDGRTPGITMPSHTAQEALIRETYAKAGLDINKPSDRCQYFEAHGTGTPAGDPQEAQAISRAFFADNGRADEDQPLYVGSIKTIIGHTEGTAGIAGVIKASLAVQHSVIPPNMLFNKLSSKVEPFYKDLCIPTEATPWPALAPGVPRRASVNSFGFGGTNAHAIVESYEPDVCSVTQSGSSIIPLNLSAHSERALRESMTALLNYISTNPDISIENLAWTLHNKKSVMPVRRSIPAYGVEAVRAHLRNEIEALSSSATSTAIKAEPKTVAPLILGIFTGQGAQWPAMGKVLIQASESARSIIEDLDRSLATLPGKDRPDWTILEELSLEGDSSHVRSATYSQPLCTAVQILLVDLLASAGIAFKAVVGHSSGEIACAYATGCLTASEAIRVAYFRGVVTEKAGGSTGSSGAMMAVGTTLDDARDFCNLDAFEGRICVAASNAADSITLSGDIDAIEQAKEVFEDEQKFARLLKVDKAYHSHHMLPCAATYVRSLTSSVLSVKRTQAPSSTVWLSSVHPGKQMTRADASARYWKDNMVSTVYFSEALTNALNSCGPFDAVVEVGPHPALKGPAMSSIQSSLGTELPYTGCLERAANDMEAFSSGLGYLWERFGSTAVDFNALQMFFAADSAPRQMIVDLPTYPWDHTRSYGVEPRITRAFLQRDHPSHQLLGDLSPNSTSETMQWTNLLRPKEIPWLDGHQLQGQTVFPAAAYAVMAMEAAKHVVGQTPISLIEILDLEIGKAITFDSESDLVEINLTLNRETTLDNETSIEMRFNCDSSLAKETSLTWSAGGRIVVSLGPGSSSTLPTAREEIPLMSDVNVDVFYNELNLVGYGYQKDFRAIENLKRTTDASAGSLRVPQESAESNPLVIHPAPLDVAFQAFIAAFCAPGDGRLWSLHVPVAIKRIAVNPWLSSLAQNSGANLDFCSNISSEISDIIQGDIDVYVPETRDTVVQVEQISFKPFTAPSKADDRLLFSEWVWGPLTPDKVIPSHAETTIDNDKSIVVALERVTYFYTKRLLTEFTPEDRRLAAPHFQYMFGWAEHITNLAQTGQHPYWIAAWEQDDEASIADIRAQFQDRADMNMLNRIGQNLPAVVNEDTDVLELMNRDDLLTKFYQEALGSRLAYSQIASLVGQVAHRHPNLEVLEIGAGFGHCTKAVLPALGEVFNGYCFTDTSSGSFEAARPLFASYEDQMSYKVLDINRPVASQGFPEHAFDLVVASNVLHNTKNLRETMKHCRQLLKPGGHMVLIEFTSSQQSWRDLIFGVGSTWWDGAEADGRVLGPTVSTGKWEEIMKDVGFSSLDTCTEQTIDDALPLSVFSARAMDTKVEYMDAPLDRSLSTENNPVVVIGGESSNSASFLTHLKERMADRIVAVVPDFTQIHDIKVPKKSTFVVLSELDSELFAHLDEDSFEGVKVMFYYAQNILWLTEDAYTENPYQIMVTGMCRTLRLEFPECQLQMLDVDDPAKIDPSLVTSTLLRLEASYNLKSDQMLWSVESELRIIDGRMYVPRLKPDVDRNIRYNSLRRRIAHPIDQDAQAIEIRENRRRLDLFASPLNAMHDTVQSNLVQIDVDFSLTSAVRIASFGYLFPIYGRVAGTKTAVIAMSTHNCSTVRVPQAWTLPATLSDQSDQLTAFIADLLATSMLASASAGSDLLVHEPSTFLAQSLRRFASEMGVRVYFSTSARQNILEGDSWLSLHPRTTQQLLNRILPRKVSAFYNMTEEVHTGSLARRIQECLPSSCDLYQLDHLYQSKSVFLGFPESFDLRRICKETTVHRKIGNDAIRRIAIADIARQEGAAVSGAPALIDWRQEDVLLARAVPIDHVALFEGNKTYILVGLTGDLGRSLCRWMIKHGARNIVLMSRNPKIDEKWLNLMGEEGAIVQARPMNVAVLESVKSALSSIEADLPPIAGVAHGPLVLQDAMFENMDLETMEMVTESKVQGSVNLEDYFGSRKLDFFVYFSSLVAAGGNRGQCNYSAANMYLSSAAARRRKRGLAASCINISAVNGVGFIARAARESDYSISKVMFMPVSEQDLHQQFAEAVVAGRPSCTTSFEITTGMPYNDPIDRDHIPYIDDPRLAFYKLPERNNVSTDNSALGGPVKDRLAEATSQEHAERIVQQATLEKLRIALQLPVDDAMDSEVPLIDQGVDSLVAVTLRTWFSKELGLDVPVLKVLGGASVADLAADAVQRLPPDAMPLLSAAESSATDIQPASGTAEQADASNASPSTPSSELRTPSEPHDNFSEIADLGETPLTQVSTGSDPEFDQSKGFFQPGQQDAQWQNPPQQVSVRENHQDQKLQRVERMSFGQSRFWLVRNLVDDQTASNVTIGMWLDGALNPGKLSKAVDIFTNRHETFRTRFFDEMDESFNAVPMQGIMEKSRVQLEVTPCKDREAAMEGFRELQRHLYNLETGDTCRMVLFTWSPRQHFFVICYHHIIMDGWGFEMMVQELDAICNDQKATAVQQYADFALRQRNEVKSGAMAAEQAYWHAQFNPPPEVLPLLPLSTSPSRTSSLSWDFYESSVRLEPMVAARIKDRSRKQKANPFHFYLAAYYVLLARLTTTSDVCIGLADANRNGIDDIRTMGFFINLLPIRLTYDASQTFGDAIIHARNQSREALNHSRLPFDVLLEQLGVTGTATHSPLFQAFLDYKQGQSESGTIGPSVISDVEMSRGRTGYDISIEVTEDPTKDPLINIKLQKNLYAQEDVDALLKSFVNILQTFSRNPAVRVDEPRLFAKADVQQALQLGRGPQQTFNGHPTLLHKVEDFCISTPDALALVSESYSLTYQQMHDRVNDLAVSISQRGVRATDCVGVMQTPHPDWICSMLAIMRIGAIYVPLDEDWPQARLDSVVGSCKPKLVLIDSTINADHFNCFGIVETFNIAHVAASSEKVKCMAEPNQTAALLYTSGTTGKPKGILVSHANLRNNIEGTLSKFALSHLKVLQQSAFTFDLSLKQIFMSLCSGGNAYIVPASKRKDAFSITELIRMEGITYTKATPSEYTNWLHVGSSNLSRADAWQYAFAGGEVLPQSVLRGILALGLEQLRFFCIYGPAEVTISSHIVEIPYKQGIPERMPIGEALPNYSTYVVDEFLKPLPVGWPGELLIGGQGVCQGYWNETDANAQFIPDSFATPELAALGHERLYRSGDKGRLTQDGMLLFDGRVSGSTFVKLRGFRIDLQDVENAIVAESQASISRAVASVRGENESRWILAHTVFFPEFPVSEREQRIRQVLAGLSVPNYMRPSMMFEIENMPLTAHGKIDRRAIDALQVPAAHISMVERQQHLSAEEQQMWEVWQQVLPTEAAAAVIPTTETEFTACGGNSILMVQLQTQLKHTLDLSIPLRELFEALSLGAMARKIPTAKRAGESAWSAQVEASLDADSIQEFMAQVSQQYPSAENSSGLRLALTGAIGFVGRHVLYELVARDDVAHVDCIGLRRSPDDKAKLEEVFHSDKVTLHFGDLADPQLGLTDASCTRIAATADIIIHCAAIRSFWDSYSTLKPVNVMPTKELVRLAAPRKTPIVFISSAIIENLPRDASVLDSAVGYTITKLISEMVLENALREFGISTTIIRMAREQDATKNLNLEAVQEILRMEKVLGKRPGFEKLGGYISLAPIIDVAHFTLESALDTTSQEAPQSKRVEYPATCVVSGDSYNEYVRNTGIVDDPEWRDLPLEETYTFMRDAKMNGFRYIVTAQDYDIGILSSAR